MDINKHFLSGRILRSAGLIGPNGHETITKISKTPRRNRLYLYLFFCLVFIWNHLLLYRQHHKRSGFCLSGGYSAADKSYGV